MKHNLFLLFLICTLGIQLQAQVTLRGVVRNLPPLAEEKIIFEYWVGEKWQQITAIQLASDHSFSLPTNAPVQAQCRIRAWNHAKNWSEFLLTTSAQGDTALFFNLDFEQMNGNAAKVQGSAENERYFQLLSRLKALSQLRESGTAEQVTEAELAFNQFCIQISAKHKGAFTGDVLAKLLYIPSKTDFKKDNTIQSMSANAFVQAHELDKIPFHLDGILYHNAFIKALHRYYNYFDHSQPNDSKAYIDQIMERRNGNEKVNQFVFSFLLNKMIDQKNEAGLEHLLKWYIPDCTDETPLPNYTQTLLEALKNCTPGKIAAELTLHNLSDQSVSLGEISKQHKLTLMLFWRSNCEHCREFEPVLIQLYQQFHPLGLEVFAVSLDKTEVEWKKHLEANPTPWINVYCPESQRKEFNRNFPTPSTPSLIALDSQRKVLDRLIIRGQLTEYLTQKLNQK